MLQGTDSVSSDSSQDQKQKLWSFLKLLLSQLIFQTEKQTQLIIFSQPPEILKIGQIHHQHEHIHPYRGKVTCTFLYRFYIYI